MDALDAFSGSFSTQLSQKAVDRRIPISGTFELLPLCNMHCKMCYIVHDSLSASTDKLQDVSFWDDVLDQAIDSGMLYCLITGGEPFIYPGIRELLERINRKPVHLALNTNATLLNEDTVRWLSKIYPGRVNISLYGGSNETYKRLCGNPKGFEQVTNAFGLLNEYHIPFRVHTTLTPENYKDFDKIIDVCNRYHAPLQMVYYMFPPYRKDKGIIENDARFTPEQAAEVAIRVLQHRVPEDERRRMVVEANCACFKEPWRYSLYGQYGILCRGGYASFWVDWRGKVSGCGIHTAEQLDLTKMSFQEAWPQIVSSTEHTMVSEKCRYCKYRCICPVCVAAAYCETGTLDGTPDYLCRFSECYAQKLQKELERLKNIYV